MPFLLQTVIGTVVSECKDFDDNMIIFRHYTVKHHSSDIDKYMQQYYPHNLISHTCPACNKKTKVSASILYKDVHTRNILKRKAD